MKLKSLALASGLACAAFGVSAQTINAAGASATRATITAEVVGSVCGVLPGTSGAITVFRAGTNVTRITCGSLVFNYDNTTGSFLGVGAVSGNGQTYQVITAANATACPTTATETISGKSVTARGGCSPTPTTTRPSIGNSDVELELFVADNVPQTVPPTPPQVPGGISRQDPAFGIVFGIVVSQALYEALQADQGLTVGSTTEANRPSLSRAQVLSLSTPNGGPLNNNWQRLFWNTNPAAAGSGVTWVRRVAGSGSQATFNANILNYICSLRGATPAKAADTGGNYTVQEFGSTGNLLTAVSSTTAFRAGFASLETAEPASGWKFVKLDGTFPSVDNVAKGRYNWMTEQVLTLASNANPTETQVYDILLAGLANVATGQPGIVSLPFVQTAGTPGTPPKTVMRTLGNNCAVPAVSE